MTVIRLMDVWKNRRRMLVEIDHHSGQPIYRQVIDQIRRQILAGQLAEGRQLDSVRELAGRLKVNPMTISKAYSLLEIEGLLERRRGVGLFVARLSEEQARRTKAQMLEDVLTRAVVTAVQLGVEEEDVMKMLRRLYERHDVKMRRQ